MTGQILPTKILLKKGDKKNKTESGLYLPDTKELTSLGEVILLGNGSLIKETGVTIGDKILFSPHAITRVVFPEAEGEFFILDIKDVLYCY